ncbi:hypothetical protein METH_04180 [Leisingera methylohalidivorans DSM 14336]|uniref:Uncharacterized protein n=1 Tax=Leisingera methylohalidivorans DSM 14336 TaxID=999552 RepID=V9VYR9_9RHOB|nr:hypothetical protein METH_04180 [Leisingera methylohalidivorans DSM 14336]
MPDLNFANVLSAVMHVLVSEWFCKALLCDGSYCP